MSTQPRVDLLVGTGPVTFDQQWEVNGNVADVGTVDYLVQNANGTTVVSGTASKSGSGASTLYQFELPIQTELTRLKITWTRLDTTAKLVHYVEVFGSQLFTESDARQSTISGFQTPFADAAKYPDEAIAAWRVRIQDQLERKTYRSWVRRYARVRLAPTHSFRLQPFHMGRAVDWEGKPLAGAGYMFDVARIISATDSGVALNVADLVLDGDTLYRTNGSWTYSSYTTPLSVVLEYEYGIDPPDPEAKGAALALLHSRAVPSDISQHVESWTDDAGSYRVGPEGWAYPTHVWEWIEGVKWRALIA